MKKDLKEIYAPAEDSFLLSEVLKKKLKDKRIKVLEVGVGSGIQLNILKEIGIPTKNLFGVDLNPEAVKHCKKLGFNCIKSNLFLELKKSKFPKKFDIIIFNPPYLPENPEEPKSSRLATTGGKNGSEIINEFLGQSKKHLKENGKIFLLTSSLTKDIKWNGFKKKLIGKEKLFFEELYVWELKSMEKES